MKLAGSVRRHPARVALSIGALFAGACASTTPSPPDPEEFLVVLNAGDATITRLQVRGSNVPNTITLGNIGGTPVALAARGSRALVTTGAGGTIAIAELSESRLIAVFKLEAGASTAGAAFLNDSIAYVADPARDQVTRFNLTQRDTLSIPVGHTPSAVVVARGRVFVVNSNLAPECDHPAPCAAGPSWISVIDPGTNEVIDSIGLPGPGNAESITLGGDGLLYVVSAGSGGEEAGRLSIVDPVLRQEVGSFGGFGVLPGRLASDGRERLFVTSFDNGLMEFNTRTRRLVRGAGAGIPVESLADAAVDGSGLVYAVQIGGCAPPSMGRIRIFRPDLTEARIVLAGPCAVDAAIVQLLLAQ
jgi:DNA-binding beta-propeller fold protein YncE